MALLKPAETAEVRCFGEVVWRVIAGMDADGLKMSEFSRRRATPAGAG
jgi:hypothetical protein